MGGVCLDCSSGLCPSGDMDEYLRQVHTSGDVRTLSYLLRATLGQLMHKYLSELKVPVPYTDRAAISFRQCVGAPTAATTRPILDSPSFRRRIEAKEAFVGRENRSIRDGVVTALQGVIVIFPSHLRVSPSFNFHHCRQDVADSSLSLASRTSSSPSRTLLQLLV